MDRLFRAQGYRQGSSIFHCTDGYTYHVNSTRPGRVYYRCIKYNISHCPGHCSSDRHLHDLRQTQAHNHAPDYDYWQVREMRRRIMESAEAQPSIRPKRLLTEARRWFPRRIAARLPLPKMRHSILKRQRVNLPNIPKSLQDLGDVLMNDAVARVASTTDFEDNMFAGFVGNGNIGWAVVFASKRMLQMLRYSVKVFSDATFKSRPQDPNSRQVWNVLTVWRHHIIPIVHVIMSEKSTELYHAVLLHLCELVPDFSPQLVMCDYEVAQMNAWCTVFNEARVTGCLFHMTKAATQHVQEIGLREAMIDSEAVYRAVRSCCAIPLLPTRLLHQALPAIRLRAQLDGVLPIVEPFFDYIEQEWLSRSDVLSVFGIADRTNNVCESFNRMLREMIGPYRPNIWMFIRTLAQVEENTCIDMSTLSNGLDASYARKCSALTNDEVISKLSQDLEAGDIHVGLFLRLASRRLQGVIDEYL